jgi:hypothetical protein
MATAIEQISDFLAHAIQQQVNFELGRCVNQTYVNEANAAFKHSQKAIQKVIMLLEQATTLPLQDGEALLLKLQRTCEKLEVYSEAWQKTLKPLFVSLIAELRTPGLPLRQEAITLFTETTTSPITAGYQRIETLTAQWQNEYRQALEKPLAAVFGFIQKTVAAHCATLAKSCDTLEKIAATKAHINTLRNQSTLLGVSTNMSQIMCLIDSLRSEQDKLRCLNTVIANTENQCLDIGISEAQWTGELKNLFTKLVELNIAKGHTVTWEERNTVWEPHTDILFNAVSDSITQAEQQIAVAETRLRIQALKEAIATLVQTRYQASEAKFELKAALSPKILAFESAFIDYFSVLINVFYETFLGASDSKPLPELKATFMNFGLPDSVWMSVFSKLLSATLQQNQELVAAQCQADMKFYKSLLKSKATQKDFTAFGEELNSFFNNLLIWIGENQEKWNTLRTTFDDVGLDPTIWDQHILPFVRVTADQVLLSDNASMHRHHVTLAERAWEFDQLLKAPITPKKETQHPIPLTAASPLNHLVEPMQTETQALCALATQECQLTGDQEYAQEILAAQDNKLAQLERSLTVSLLPGSVEGTLSEALNPPRRLIETTHHQLESLEMGAHEETETVEALIEPLAHSLAAHLQKLSTYLPEEIIEIETLRDEIFEIRMLYILGRVENGAEKSWELRFQTLCAKLQFVPDPLSPPLTRLIKAILSRMEHVNNFNNLYLIIEPSLKILDVLQERVDLQYKNALQKEAELAAAQLKDSSRELPSFNDFFKSSIPHCSTYLNSFVDENGNCLLLLAIKRKAVAYINGLLEFGARRDVWDKSGCFAFEAALASGLEPSVIERLVFNFNDSHPQEMRLRYNRVVSDYFLAAVKADNDWGIYHWGNCLLQSKQNFGIGRAEISEQGCEPLWILCKHKSKQTHVVSLYLHNWMCVLGEQGVYGKLTQTLAPSDPLLADLPHKELFEQGKVDQNKPFLSFMDVALLYGNGHAALNLTNNPVFGPACIQTATTYPAWYPAIFYQIFDKSTHLLNEVNFTLLRQLFEIEAALKCDKRHTFSPEAFHFIHTLRSTSVFTQINAEEDPSGFKRVIQRVVFSYLLQSKLSKGHGNKGFNLALSLCESVIKANNNRTMAAGIAPLFLKEPQTDIKPTSLRHLLLDALLDAASPTQATLQVTRALIPNFTWDKPSQIAVGALIALALQPHDGETYHDRCMQAIESTLKNYLLACGQAKPANTKGIENAVTFWQQAKALAESNHGAEFMTALIKYIEGGVSFKEASFRHGLVTSLCQNTEDVRGQQPPPTHRAQLVDVLKRYRSHLAKPSEAPTATFLRNMNATGNEEPRQEYGQKK